MAGINKQVLDEHAGKGFAEAQSNEHLRNRSDRAREYAEKIGNYDRTREHLNFEIDKGKVVPVDKSKSIPQSIRENLDSRGIKDPNQGLAEPKFRTVSNIILGGAREAMRNLAFGNQDVDFSKGADNSHISRRREIEQWSLDAYNFIAQKFGEENIARFVVHLDELNPHCHCTLLPIREGKFAYKKIFNGETKYGMRDYMIALHDEFALVNKKWGLERGDSIEITGAKHRTTEEYRRALSRECTSLEDQIRNDKEVLDQLRKEISFSEKRVKSIATMIANLEQIRERLEEEMEQMAADLRSGNGDMNELQRRIDSLSRQYEDVLSKLSDKRGKLVEANRKLAEFRSLEDESKEKIEEYKQMEKDFRESALMAAGDQSKQARFAISDVAMSQLLDELKVISPAIEHAKDALGDTLLYDIASNGQNILKCATLLFMGYVDGAVTFAKSCGGSGGNPSGWGKENDEDENRFRRRCLFTASRMMRAPGSKKVKRK